MRFPRRPLATGLRAHPANRDPNEPTDRHDETSGARRRTRRWRVRTAVGVTAIAMLATAGPALAAGDPTSAAPATTGHVYWSTIDFSGLPGTIGRANLNGTMADQNFIPGATQPFASPEVAVDAAHIYWTDERAGTIARANLDGTGLDQSFITGVSDTGGGTVTVPKDGGPGTSNFPALRVAVDAAHVYWTNSATGTIGRANLDGTHVNRKFITGVGSPLGVAVDAAHVYWADSATGTIGRANLDGTHVNRKFITGVGSPLGVAVDAAHVYWADSATGTIGRANLDGSGVNPTGGVAVDAAHVYWANAQTIGRANLDGTAMNLNFITAGAPDGVAVDAGHVYWANDLAFSAQPGSQSWSIGRADLDGRALNLSFITGATQPLGVAVDHTTTP
jgi:virginiamycin B lyase